MERLRLVVFDVDGTLMRVKSSWQHLHEELGTWDRGRRNAERFFQGLITYEEWARLDASLWRGLPVERIQRIIYRMAYTSGVQEVITTLRGRGFKVALLSAGLSLVTERIRKKAGIDYSLANELIVNGFLTGGVKVNVPVHGKEVVLRRVLQRLGGKAEECAAVGDDQTMIPLFERVGLGIAFNPHEKTVEVYKECLKSSLLPSERPHPIFVRGKPSHHAGGHG